MPDYVGSAAKPLSGRAAPSSVVLFARVFVLCCLVFGYVSPRSTAYGCRRVPGASTRLLCCLSVVLAVLCRPSAGLHVSAQHLSRDAAPRPVPRLQCHRVLDMDTVGLGPRDPNRGLGGGVARLPSPTPALFALYGWRRPSKSPMLCLPHHPCQPLRTLRS